MTTTPTILTGPKIDRDKTATHAVQAMMDAWIAEIKDAHLNRPFRPPEVVEIDVVGLAETHFQSYDPVFAKYTYAEVPLWGKNRVIGGHVRIYWNGTGVFNSSCYRDGPGYGPLAIKFWRFGCVHKYVEIGRDEATKHGVQMYGPCDHAEKCTKCGHVWAYNSGD